jgi:hypothetical protein
MSALAAHTDAYAASRSAREQRLLEAELASITASASTLPAAARTLVQAVLESLAREEGCELIPAVDLHNQLAALARLGPPSTV